MKHQQVVVAYDFSPHGDAVLARAVALVQRAPSHVLQFITVIERSADYEYADDVRDQLAAKIRQAFGDTKIPEQIHIYTHTRIGTPGEEIIALAEEVGADLIFVGTHGRSGISRLVLGSTAEYVMREAGCPVMIVRPKRYPDVDLPDVVEVKSHHVRSKVLSYHGSIGADPIHWATP